MKILAQSLSMTVKLLPKNDPEISGCNTRGCYIANYETALTKLLQDDGKSIQNIIQLELPYATITFCLEHFAECCGLIEHAKKALEDS